MTDFPPDELAARRLARQPRPASGHWRDHLHPAFVDVTHEEMAFALHLVETGDYIPAEAAPMSDWPLAEGLQAVLRYLDHARRPHEALALWYRDAHRVLCG